MFDPRFFDIKFMSGETAISVKALVDVGEDHSFSPETRQSTITSEGRRGKGRGSDSQTISSTGVFLTF